MPNWAIRFWALCLIIFVASLPLGIAWLTTSEMSKSLSHKLQDEIAEFIVKKVDQSFDNTVIAVVGLDQMSTLAFCSHELRVKMNSIIQNTPAIRELRLITPDNKLICGSAISSWDISKDFIALNGNSTKLYPAYSKILDRQAFVIHVELTQNMIAEAIIVLDASLLEAMPDPLSAIVEIGFVAPNGGSLFKDESLRLALRNYANLSDKSEHQSVIFKSSRFAYAINITFNPNDVRQFFKLIIQLPYYFASALSLMLLIVLIRRYDAAYFELQQNKLNKKRLAFEAAIENKEFIPYYQPIYNTNTQSIVGCEVLMRWRKSDGRIISPLAFLEELEDEGHARRVTLILMQQVLLECEQILKDNPDFRLSFNLFASQFEDFQILSDIESTFSASPVKYNQLVFEITEHRPLPNITHAQQLIVKLQKLGCKIALDDVGVGASNLITLQELGVDQLKIDRQFISSMPNDHSVSPIVEGLISIAQKMNIEIAAEGIETQAQLTTLLNNGVSLMQGNFLAPAMPIGQFLQMFNMKSH